MNSNKNIVNEIVKNEAENSVNATGTETTEFVVDKYIRHRWLVIRSRCGKQKGYENVTFELDDYPRFQECSRLSLRLLSHALRTLVAGKIADRLPFGFRQLVV